jgi:hypothetical protein
MGGGGHYFPFNMTCHRACQYRGGEGPTLYKYISLWLGFVNTPIALQYSMYNFFCTYIQVALIGHS